MQLCRHFFFFAFSRGVIGVIVFHSQMFFVCAFEILSRILKIDHLFEVPESTAHRDCSNCKVFLENHLVSPQVTYYLQDSLKFNFLSKILTFNLWRASVRVLFREYQVCLFNLTWWIVHVPVLPAFHKEKYILRLKRNSCKRIIGVSWTACFFQDLQWTFWDVFCFVFTLFKSGRGGFAVFARFLVFFFFLIKSKRTCKSFTSLLFSFCRFPHTPPPRDEKKPRFFVLA